MSLNGNRRPEPSATSAEPPYGRKLRRRASFTLRGPWLRRLLVLGLLTMLAGPTVARSQPSAAADGLLPSGFSINAGAAWTKREAVTIGDAGRSPFFRPGVVVWDGGSILGGRMVPAELRPAAQTLRLVPHPVTSIASISGSATIADMLAEADIEVDAHYSAEADASVCVIMAGGGDFARDHDVDSVYAMLRQYCLERKAAGLQVVVVTLLPRTQPAGFEEKRLAFNELVRGSWSEFADGLADVAADPRIGDTGDNMDRQYYCVDQVHPTAAGYTVIGTIIAPALNDLAWQSSDCEIRLRTAPDDWSPWRPYAAHLGWHLGTGDGIKTVEAEYHCMTTGATATVADSIRLDTVGPRTKALRRATVRRGRTATLRYRVDDPAPGSKTGTTSILIRRQSGKIVKHIRLGKRVTGKSLAARFVCRLPRGNYRFEVNARDAAGNRQTVAGSARLTVY